MKKGSVESARAFLQNVGATPQTEGFNVCTLGRTRLNEDLR